MAAEIFNTLGTAAGIGGIAFGVLYLVFKSVLNNTKMFPKLPAELAYRILRLLIVLTFSALLVGVAAWLISITLPLFKQQDKPSTTQTYTREPQDEYPGIEIVYPENWTLKEAGTGVPTLFPPRDARESELGLRIEIVISSLSRTALAQDSGVNLADSAKDNATLTDNQFKAFITTSMTAQYDDGLVFKGERLTDISVYSAADASREITTAHAWIVDYVQHDLYYRGLHFLQQPAPLSNTPERDGMIEVTCVAPAINFAFVSAACDSILAHTAAVSVHYFED